MSTPIFPSFIIIDTPWLLHTLSAHFLDEKNKARKINFPSDAPLYHFPLSFPDQMEKNFITDISIWKEKNF
jgi:hypothetical protein